MRYSRSVFIFAGAIAVGVLVAGPTFGQVINEDLKLLASDGAAEDFFGYSIAIDNGSSSGSAYVFDGNRKVAELVIVAVGHGGV